ncbi:MAG: rRNA adenine N-6-methyltransferase family protein [Burkholderiaceae bacterium]|nr:rRNA adenine N-6-methyltransferase family protein [Burkholderiaceae bacterium]
MSTAEPELQAVRRAYAQRTLAGAKVVDERLQSAFASVRREAFLSPGPWPILQQQDGTYRNTSDANPAHLYTDDLIGIAPERGINNGQPRLHAELLSLAAIQAGEHIVHVGAGAGYYTAIMAELAGTDGRVTAIEFAEDLAARATKNLSDRPNVTVIHGDGSVAAFDEADVIYVNAGATHPADNWLDRLRVGGRLILPLTTREGFAPVRTADVRRGGVFLVSRANDGFLARWISGVAIYPCEGMRDSVSERALAAAFEGGGWERVTRLVRREDIPAAECWLKGPGWCLT